MRRNANQLERAVEAARTERAQALALYRLAVFHDNNSREAAVIPYYRRALSLRLDRRHAARAAAWLASSLYKTLRWTERALAGHCPTDLRWFLIGLRERIRRNRSKPAR